MIARLGPRHQHRFAAIEVAGECGAEFVGRNGELPDLAGAAIYLASRAPNYVKSQTIVVDGGISAD